MLECVLVGKRAGHLLFRQLASLEKARLLQGPGRELIQPLIRRLRDLIRDVRAA